MSAGTPATSAECTERGSSVIHWYSEIRSHHASVAQPSLVTGATKDTFQDRHSDVLMFEWTGTFLSDCIVVSAIPGRRPLRSATSGQLYIPRTRTVTFGPRSFKVCGPTIWNDLPARMKDPSLSFDSFRKLLRHSCLIGTVAQWYRLPLGTEQVVSSIPGSVGYISHVH